MEEQTESQALNMRRIKNKTKKRDVIIIWIVNSANVCLVIIKGVTAYVSSSFSIGTSTIESFGDVFVSGVILAQSMMDKRVKASLFPRGKSSEATSNLVSSAVMMSLAFVNWLLGLDALLTGTLKPEFGFAHISVVIFNIFTKLFLFAICRLKREDDQIYVLMRDQLTDVITNSVALIAVCLSYFVWASFDFIGCTIIIAVIFRNWIPLAHKAWFRLQGVVGSKSECEEIRKILAENSNRFETFAGFLIYHLGNKIIVEIFGDFASIDDQVFITDAIDEMKDVQKCYIMPASLAGEQSAIQKIEKTEKIEEIEKIEKIEKIEMETE